MPRRGTTGIPREQWITHLKAHGCIVAGSNSKFDVYSNPRLPNAQYNLPHAVQSFKQNEVNMLCAMLSIPTLIPVIPKQPAYVALEVLARHILQQAKLAKTQLSIPLDEARAICKKLRIDPTGLPQP